LYLSQGWDFAFTLDKRLSSNKISLRAWKQSSLGGLDIFAAAHEAEIQER
jgi:hypothetical protein